MSGESSEVIQLTDFPELMALASAPAEARRSAIIDFVLRFFQTRRTSDSGRCYLGLKPAVREIEARILAAKSEKGRPSRAD